MTRTLTLNIAPTAYKRIQVDWLPGLKPYVYQQCVYQLVQEALARNETLCLFLVTPTGSGKTLASYAYAINHELPALGVYPTNELIRDQERSLKTWIDPQENYRLLRVDSRQLDDWQTKLALKHHSDTLETLFNWQPTILTNPDILFYIFFGLYAKYPVSVRQRLFTLVGSVYRLFMFDEFHLYNVKQMADTAFLVGTLHAINPHKGRVFIFASATPELEAVKWLRENLKLRVEVVEGQPSDAPDARTIAHPLQLTLLPADLGRWQGVEALLEYLPQLQQFAVDYPQARMVTILDSVTGAISLAQTMRETFPDKTVGEVHGFSSPEERETATRQPLTVGTSTIEVGIDFKGATEKDVLIYEARMASQFVQRFGRLARHEKSLPIPNRVVALIPEYVYNFFTERANDGLTLSRPQLYSLAREAYQRPQDFARYLTTHAPVEFHEARWFVQGLFQSDDRPRITEELGNTIEALTGKTAGQAWGKHRQYKEEHILKPLLTFRGSGFEAAILDERGTDVGFPVKRYNLMFLLRRGVFEEIDEEEYLARLEALENHRPEEVARERRYGKRIGRTPEDLLGIYGYFVLTALRDQGRKVWFEIDEEQVYGRIAQVTTVSGLEIVTDPPVRLRRLNRHLRRKQIVAWFAKQHPASIKLGRALPPLFALYELRVLRPGGALSEQKWSMAFNQDAFFVDSLGWYRQRREDRAIIF
ncbi:MAG: type I-D CRISPR-associated helicase Cas3' [Chloroflexota bacterium]|nr:type I-D CRISPR-associated helicase Cas3' [Chloroflexota bacterium]